MNKKPFSTSGPFRISLILWAMLFFVWVACNKGSPEYQAKMTLWNAVPNSQGLVVKTGETELNANLLFNQPDYARVVLSGTQVFSWGRKGSTTQDSAFVTDFAPGTNLTLIFYDSLSKYKAFFVRDRWQQTAQPGKAFYRFFPLIIGGSALTVENDTGRVLISSRNFADFTGSSAGGDFAAIDSVTNKFRLVQGTGNSRVVLDSIVNGKLEEGKSYSFYATGILRNIGNARPKLFLHLHQ